MLEDETEDKPLALMNGGFNDDFNDSQPPMKAVLPPPGYANRVPPRTAGSKVRPNKRHQGNSLNLQAPKTKDSQSRLQTANNQHQNILLGRIENNKYVTDKDEEIEAVKMDESKRRQRLENVNYQLFQEDLINVPHDSAHNTFPQQQ